MVEHHALGRARRSGRVLQKGQRLAVNVGRPPLPVESLGHVAGIQPGELLEVRRFVDQALDAVEHRVGGERDFRFGVVGDGLDALHRAVAAGRIDRHGHHARIQAAEKPDDELQPGRIEQQAPVRPTAPCDISQAADRAGLAVEFRVGQIDLVQFAVPEIGEGDVAGLRSRPMTDHFHQGQGAKKSSWQVFQMLHVCNPLQRVCFRAVRQPHFRFTLGQGSGAGSRHDGTSSFDSADP